MAICLNCKTELTAINMSEDEDLCKDCYDVKLETMTGDDESPETREFTDAELDRIINAKMPIYETIGITNQNYRKKNRNRRK